MRLMMPPQSPPGAVLRVAEARHQSRDGFRHPLRTVAGRAGLVREAEAGERQGDHVERILGAAAVFHRIGQRSDHLRELDDRAGPAVRQDQRQGAEFLRTLVDEVNVETVDVRLELIELIEPPLLRPPVERGAPVGDELLEVRQVRAVIPARAVDAIREPGRRQSCPQVPQDIVGNVNREGEDRGAILCALGAGRCDSHGARHRQGRVSAVIPPSRR